MLCTGKPYRDEHRQEPIQGIVDNWVAEGSVAKVKSNNAVFICVPPIVRPHPITAYQSKSECCQAIGQLSEQITLSYFVTNNAQKGRRASSRVRGVWSSRSSQEERMVLTIVANTVF